TLEIPEAKLNVRLLPGGAKLAFDLIGGGRLALRAERMHQAEERPPVARVAHQIVPKHRLALLRMAGLAERGTERLTHRIVPSRRLVVGERILALHRTAPC